MPRKRVVSPEEEAIKRNTCVPATVRGKHNASASELRIRELEAEVSLYAEAFRALRRGETPVSLTAGEGADAYTIEVLALTRAHGGIVIDNGTCLILLDEFRSLAHARAGFGVGYHARDVADKAVRLREDRLDSTLGRAVCTQCCLRAKVCCSSQTIDNPDGSKTYVDAVCTQCCGPHPKIHSGVGGYSRTDCDT